MIGINDPINNNNDNNNGASGAIQAPNGGNDDWGERHRRQCTIRLMLMFVMMLILMDGEESEHRKHKHNHTSHLRKSMKKPSQNLNVIRPKSLYDSRRSMDRRIEASSIHGEGNRRLENLFKLNKDQNEESLVVDWAVKNWNKFNNLNEENDEAKIRKKKHSETSEDPESKRLVYHYPYNITGYYRGEWNILAEKKRDKFLTEKQETQNQMTTIVTSTKPEKTAIQDVVDKGDLNSKINVITQDEVYDKVIDEMSIGEKIIGVYTMPKMTRILSMDLVNLFNSTIKLEKQKNYKRAMLDFLDVEDLHSLIPQSAELSLTETNGRAAFQLFSRPIPGMTQISLVDGFVKLLNGEVGPFSSKRDILLRVRGVAIHKIGKLSLVSNAEFGRTGMFLVDRKPSRIKADSSKIKKANVVKKERLNSEEGEEEEKVERRRLIDLMNELPSKINYDLKDQKQKDINEIRQSALSAYKNFWDEHQIGGGSWNTLFSSGESYDIQTEELQNSNDVETGVASIVSNFFNVDRMMNNLDSAYSFGIEYFASKYIGNERIIHEVNTPMADNIKSVSNKKHENERRVLTAIDTSVGVGSNDGSFDFEKTVMNTHTSRKQKQIAIDVPTDQEKKENLVEEDNDEKGVFTILSSEGEQKTTDTAKEKALMNLLEKEWSTFDTNTLFSYPYVPDDAKRSLHFNPQSMSRRIPSREQIFIDNAKNCEFELDLDITAEQWTVGEWRNMVQRQISNLKNLNPYFHPIISTDDTDDEDGKKEGKAKEERTTEEQSVLKSSQSTFPELMSNGKDEAMVMGLLGKIESSNCNFGVEVNVTAIRTDWEQTTGKAINYSFCMMITCLVQIVVLLRQLLHTGAQSVATRVSLLCIGWQTVLDAMMCIEHMLLSLLLQPLFTAFASVAFFKLLIFCVIEMKYMTIIIQARNNANNIQTTVESLRRQVALLHLKFYLSLMFALMTMYYIGQNHRTLYMVLLYSFWVPQIIRNVITEAKKPLHNYYIYGMSVTRLVAPTYFLAVHGNFLKAVSPDFPTDVFTVQITVLWVGLQTAVLIAQTKYGARFMIPASFLPPKFDYSRPIPPSLLPQPMHDEISISSSDGNNASLLGTDIDTTTSLSSSTIGPRNRMKGNRSRTMSPSSDDSSNSNGTMQQNSSTSDSPVVTLDCVICYNAIDISNPRGYMLAPCDHIFHKECLEQWMEVKMECPICRNSLPSI